MSSLAEHRRFLVAVILAALVLSASAWVVAQTGYPDVPVLVAGEDEGAEPHGWAYDGPWIVPRSHEIFQRALAEIKGIMSRAGFRVIDEAAVAVDRDWEIRDGRPKKDLIDLAKTMNRSADATHGVRALVLFSIRVTPNRRLHGLDKFRLRMRGEIHDLASNQFVDTVEEPQEYGEMPGCLNDLGCFSEKVGGRAREVAVTLGDGLAAKLARYRKASTGGITRGGVTTTEQANRGHGIETLYTITFNYFDRREAVTIIAVMADEFPGYKSHELMRTDQAVRRYRYITTAKLAKMEEWLTILLADMNFDPDKEIRIAIDGTDIIVEKIVPTWDRPRSADEKALFK